MVFGALGRDDEEEEWRNQDHAKAGDDVQPRENRLTQGNAFLSEFGGELRGQYLGCAFGGGHRQRCRTREATMPDHESHVASGCEQWVVAGNLSCFKRSTHGTRQERTNNQRKSPVDQSGDDGNQGHEHGAYCR